MDHNLKEASLRYVKEDSQHIHKIVKISKLDPNRTIRSLSEQEFEKYWKAIEKNENWKVGREDFIERWYISGVHKKKGTIAEYLIDKSNQQVWISKKEALKLAFENKLHATIVCLSNEKKYLRSEYGLGAFSKIL